MPHNQRLSRTKLAQILRVTLPLKTGPLPLCLEMSINRGPADGALLVGPATFTVSADSSDTDGSINKVDFFDNGELVATGTPSGNNHFFVTEQNVSFGPHTLIAVATDNGGRQNVSTAINVIVNGAANVTITSPSSGALYAPGANISMAVNASHPSGIINKVEFFSNGNSVGIGTPEGSDRYTATFSIAEPGIYSIAAVASDSSGITTTSTAINLTVDALPTITIDSPVNGTVFPSSTNISVTATAQSPSSPIARVDFYANGDLIGSATNIVTNRFILTWRHIPNGILSLTAVATDTLGVTAQSTGITIGVNTPVPSPGEFIWFDDTLPAGAIKHADGERRLVLGQLESCRAFRLGRTPIQKLWAT